MTICFLVYLFDSYFKHITLKDLVFLILPLAIQNTVPQLVKRQFPFAPIAIMQNIDIQQIACFVGQVDYIFKGLLEVVILADTEKQVFCLWGTT